MTKCKRCGANNVHWKPSANTRTGVQLHNADETPHICNYTFSDFNELLARFWNNIVIHDSDSPAVVITKKQWQDKLRWKPTPEERKTMAENREKYKFWYQ